MMDFPFIEWSKFRWTTRIIVPEWAGFQSRLGAYGGLNSAQDSDGEVPLWFEAPDENWAPSDAQKAAYFYLRENGGAIRDAILHELLAVYPRWQSEMAYEPENQNLMPDVKAIEDFKSLLGLSNIHILTMEKDAFAYVGFEFGCCWEEEHGMGALVHQARVIEIGAADAAFDGWNAEKDGGLDPAQDVRDAQAAQFRSLKAEQAAKKPPEPTQLSLFEAA